MNEIANFLGFEITEKFFCNFPRFRPTVTRFAA